MDFHSCLLTFVLLTSRDDAGVLIRVRVLCFFLFPGSANSIPPDLFKERSSTPIAHRVSLFPVPHPEYVPQLVPRTGRPRRCWVQCSRFVRRCLRTRPRTRPTARHCSSLRLTREVVLSSSCFRIWKETPKRIAAQE
jgi:hypothetical protein